MNVSGEGTLVEIDLSTTSIDFGEVFVDGAYKDTLIVTNSGTDLCIWLLIGCRYASTSR